MPPRCRALRREIAAVPEERVASGPGGHGGLATTRASPHDACVRAADYLMPGGALSRAIDGWEHRPAQLTMAEAVERVLEHQGVLLVEAGTGTGKTLAYLLPALLVGRRVVISTGTKTLQDQIMEHDLPMLERHLGLTVEAASMKGLSNYLCLRRLEELRRHGDSVRGVTARHLPLLERWRATSGTGDRAELSDLPEGAPIWPQVCSSPETRVGARCAFYEDCFVTSMRRRAERAQIVVVNHHLFFADLATRGPHGGGIIPDYEAVVFDEAHQIEDVVTQFFGVQVSTTRIEVLVRDAERAFAAAGLDPEAAELGRNVLDQAAGFFRALPRELGEGVAEGGRASLPQGTISGALEERMCALDAALEALAASARRHADQGESVAQMARRASQIRDDVATVAEGGGGSHVTWIEQRGRSASVGASPVDVSGVLRDELFHRVPSVVMTSATLSTAGSFEFIERRLGIDFEVDELLLPPPFDYPTQAALYLPAQMPDPREAGYLEAATGEIRRLVGLTGGGAFVLCTSLRVMNALADRCRPDLTQEILVQGEAPKGLLLDRFRDLEDAVLFATVSFWEGVDVPGRALRLVIIDKLPFEVPSDPLVEARCERLREAGEQPFMKYLVPSAALSLKQGFGRLVRSRRDRGIVAILDSRIVTKGYGKVFLRSLPEARRCDAFAEVQAFWDGTAKETAAGASPRV